jgi:hypothetical protein
MRNLLLKKEQYLKTFASNTYSFFLKNKYGINSCPGSKDQDLSYMRKEIIQWQSIEDAGALTEVSFRTWLPIEYEQQQSSNGGPGYINSTHQYQNIAQGTSAQFVAENGQTILEVNAGGCVTKINLTPVINMSGTSTDNFAYIQSIPSTQWVVTHNLGYKPVVETKDQDGNTIDGVVNYLNNTTLSIDFSEPVSGTAYLS